MFQVVPCVWFPVLWVRIWTSCPLVLLWAPSAALCNPMPFDHMQRCTDVLHCLHLKTTFCPQKCIPSWSTHMCTTLIHSWLCCSGTTKRALCTPSWLIPLVGMMQVQMATDFGCFSDCSFLSLPVASTYRVAASSELCVFRFGQGCPFPCTDTGTILGPQLSALPAASGGPSQFEAAVSNGRGLF